MTPTTSSRRSGRRWRAAAGPGEPIVVPLTAADRYNAHLVAERRMRVHRDVGRRDGKVLADGLEVARVGCLGELAVAKGLGLEWDGRLFDNESWLAWRRVGHDVSGLEVRATTRPAGRLLVKPRDRDEARFVLVRIPDPCAAVLVGWAYGREAKRDLVDVGYGRPCYFLPDDRLRPLSTLEIP